MPPGSRLSGRTRGRFQFLLVFSTDVCYITIMRRTVAASAVQAIEAAVAVLKDGGVLAFPTDTVYGIGCDAYCEDAVARIYAVKKRPKDKALVMLLADEGDVAHYVRRPGRSVSVLCERFFPGSLTVIMRARRAAPPGMVSKRRTISIRIPDHPFIRKVVRCLGRPIASTSANIAGCEAAKTHKSIRLSVDLVVMDDMAVSGIPSAVLDTSVFPFVLRRKGALSIYGIERFITSKVRLDASIGFNVVFVCAGNSCRSPMAEGMLSTMVSEYGLRGIGVSSCGLTAISGYPASENAVATMQAYGHDISHHRSRSILDCDLLEGDLILCMEAHQRDVIRSRYARVAERTFLLTEYCGKKGDIPDPVGAGRQRYDIVARQIEKCVRKVASDLALRYGRRRGREEG